MTLGELQAALEEIRGSHFSEQLKGGIAFDLAPRNDVGDFI